MGQRITPHRYSARKVRRLTPLQVAALRAVLRGTCQRRRVTAYGRMWIEWVDTKRGAAITAQLQFLRKRGLIVFFHCHWQARCPRTLIIITKAGLKELDNANLQTLAHATVAPTRVRGETE